jgi:hypothetical protein
MEKEIEFEASLYFFRAVESAKKGNLGFLCQSDRVRWPGI